MYQKDSKSFLLGTALQGSKFSVTDLPRNSDDPPRALIGDPRNDENTIVSQLQGLFHRFHNRLVSDNPTLSFPHIQKLVRFHYQYILLHDFLPRIIQSEVLAGLKETSGKYDQKKLKFFHWKNGPFMPVEFSVAAYRIGHSMVRPGYRLNDATLLPIFNTPEAKALGFDDDLSGFRKVVDGRAIDWGRFIDIDTRPYGDPDKDDDPNNKTRLQFAYRMDTSVVFPLGNLPMPVVGAPPMSLPVRNLIRGWRLELPSGQHVARAMGVPPMEDKDILIGKGVDTQDTKNDPPIVSIDKISSVFVKNCPLWTYILAEAMHHQISVKIPISDPARTITTPQLGPVGGRIVAEVFLGLMFGDNHSLLVANPDWKPNNPSFALKDFVNYALGLGQPFDFGGKPSAAK